MARKLTARAWLGLGLGLGLGLVTCPAGNGHRSVGGPVGLGQGLG